MSYKVSLSDKAEDDFARLDKSVQKQIFKYLGISKNSVSFLEMPDEF